MPSKDPLVLYETEERVATITLNRPQKLNALNRELYAQLDAALTKAESDPHIRVLILSAAGRAFSAGADLDGESAQGVLARWEQYETVNRRQFRLWESEKITIAAVHGYCLGRGLELALWCDIVLAAEDAQFGQPEVRDGSFVSSMVPWLLGPQQAKLFMLTGDRIPAVEAATYGLVARVVPVGQALAEARKLGQRLSHVPAVTAGAVKRLINSTYSQQGLRSAQSMGTLFSALISSMSAAEKGIEDLERIRQEQGLKAYLEARDAPFKA